MALRLLALLLPASVLLLTMPPANNEPLPPRSEDSLPAGALVRLGSVRHWTGAVRSVAISPAGSFVAAGGDDGIVRLWNLNTGKVAYYLRDETQPIFAVAFSPDSKLLAAGTQPIRLWEIETGKEIRQVGWGQAPLAFGRDGKTLIAGHEVLRLDATAGEDHKLNRLVWPELGGQISSSQRSPDGKALAVASYAGRVFHIDLQSGQSKRLPAKPTNRPFVTFTPDGKSVASAGGDCLRLWRVATGQETRPFGESSVSFFAFSPDGKTVAWVDSRQEVRFGEIATGKQAVPFVGHQSDVTCLCFSSDGTTIASGSMDGTVLLWDATGLRSGGRLLFDLIASEAGREADKRRPAISVPEDANISVHFDRQRYFLGENIIAHFCVENAGKGIFPISFGGDYRGAARSLRFSVTAVDVDGQEALDPCPSQMCLGGICCTKDLKPGEKHWESLQLLRYCRFDKPGTYRVQVSHDLGWSSTKERPVPAGEATVVLVMPSEEEALQVFDRTYELPADHGGTHGQKREAFADFGTLSCPVYLPLLKRRASQGCSRALEGIALMPVPAATETLINLLDHHDAKLAAEVARKLIRRLPEPPAEVKENLAWPWSVLVENTQESHHWLVRESWRFDFASRVRSAARYLIRKPERESQVYGARMLACVGQKEDMPDLIRAVDWAVCQTRTAVEANAYPQPRNVCQEFMRTVRIVHQRGGRVPENPENPGEAIVFLNAIGTRDDYRPRDWEKKYAELMKHEIAYVREVALQHLPQPLTKPWLDHVAVLLADADVNVRIAACYAAGSAKAAELKEPVIKVLQTTREDSLLNAAHNAACQLEIGYREIEIWVDRLDEEGMTATALNYLVGKVIAEVRSMSSPTRGMLDVEAGKACKTRWLQFLQQNGSALKAGKLFKLGDPALTADLFPLFDFSR